MISWVWVTTAHSLPWSLRIIVCQTWVVRPRCSATHSPVTVLPAGAMGLNHTLEIDTAWTYPNSATTKTLGAYFGSFKALDRSRTTSVTETSLVRIINRASASAQIHPFKNATYFTAGASAIPTSTVDTSAAVTIRITGQWGSAGAGSNNITLESALIRIRA